MRPQYCATCGHNLLKGGCDHDTSDAQDQFEIHQARTTIATLTKSLERAESSLRDQKETYQFGEDVMYKIVMPNCHLMTKGEIALDFLLRITKSLEEVSRQRDNLLCRIHRDGGHYIHDHGIEKACEDADLIVANLNAESDTTKKSLEEARKWMRHDEECFRYVKDTFGGRWVCTCGLDAFNANLDALLSTLGGAK